MAAPSYRFARHPKWVAGHVLVLAAIVTMVLLGRWQLLVSDRKHFNLQNFGYSLQWWAFSIFALVFWLKIVRDAARGTGPGPASEPSQPAEAPRTPDEPVAYRRYVMPTQSGPSADPEVARYNAYLAHLAERDES